MLEKRMKLWAQSIFLNKDTFLSGWDIPFKNSDFPPSFIWYISELYTMLYGYQLQSILFGKYDYLIKISILAVSFYKNYKTSNHNMKSGVIIFYTFVVLCTSIPYVYFIYIQQVWYRYNLIHQKEKRASTMQLKCLSPLTTYVLHNF